MNEGYLRQRRNLISISILLLMTILATDSRTSPLFPYLKITKPHVAEFFIWLGFAYFWYRTRIYEPSSIETVFQTEIFIAYLLKTQPEFLLANNLTSFTGIIKFTPMNQEKSQVFFIGKNDQGSSITSGQITTEVPINKDDIDSVILSGKNKINNWLHGKTFTDYYLPHWIAFITLFAGIVAKLDLNTWHAIGFVVIIFLVSKIE